MLNYERDLIRKAWSGVRRAERIIDTATKRAVRAVAASIAGAAKFILRQIQDPAVRRAVLLGVSAYLIRKAPFLDQGTAEGLSDKVLVLAGVVLSKLPGTLELKARGAGAPPAGPTV